MRKVLLVSMAIWGVLMLSCSPEKMPEGKVTNPTTVVTTPSITVGKSSLSFGSNSSSETVMVTANVEWDFECSESWVTASKGSTSQLNVSVTSNSSNSSRNASISLKQQGKSTTFVTISISQSGTAVIDEISASRTSLSYGAGGGTENITVISNFTWEVINKPSWITLSPSSGSNGSTSVTVTADKSTSTSERTGTIKLGKGTTSVSVAVSQDAIFNSSEYDKKYVVKGNGNTVIFTMKYVKSGSFIMGTNNNSAFDSEKPAHNVTLSNDYYMGETEVTQELWETVMGSNPSYFKGQYLPANGITWTECQDFVAKLNSITGEKFRLPTEAEWEYAARGGNRGNGYEYSGSNEIDNVAWYMGNCNEPHDVAKKKANELGIYDMTGNVNEWCQDNKRIYDSKSQIDPTCSNGYGGFIFRGGGFTSQAGYSQVWRRDSTSPNSDASYFGLRLAL